MGADAAIGDQPDVLTPFTQHRRRACETVAGFRRQVLAFEAERCTEQKQGINAVEVRLGSGDGSVQSQCQPG